MNSNSANRESVSGSHPAGGRKETFPASIARQIGAPDTPLQSALLLRLPLRTHQARDEIGVADLVLVGGTQLFLVDFQDAPEFEISSGVVPVLQSSRSGLSFSRK